jgi:HEPN domain-containing protein
MVKSDTDHARQLLAMAETDHAALTNMLDAQKFPEQIFGFHAQQAIEKALKAWISFLRQPYPKTHDLSVLVGALREAGVELSSFPRLEDYTVFAVQYRYESYDTNDELLDRHGVVQEVSGLLSTVQKAIRSAR